MPSPIATATALAAKPAKPRRLEELARGRAGCFPITPSLIQPEPDFNARLDYGDLDVLAADILANGLQQPLKIRKEHGTEDIFLIDGHRRLAAINLLIGKGQWPADKEDPELPAPIECTSEKRGTSPTSRLFMQLSMNTGKPFTFLEEAILYQRILDADATCTMAEIARRTGKTKQAISDSIRLIRDASPAITTAVQQGHIAATTALAIIREATAKSPEEHHAIQDELLTLARQAAHAAGRPGHIMPKDLAHTTPPHQPPANEDDTTPDTTPATTPPPAAPPATPSFTLAVIDGAPEEPYPNTTEWHETDRFALSHPPEDSGIQLLHLLSSSTREGIFFGFRINDHEAMPSPDIVPADASPLSGFITVLHLALKHAREEAHTATLEAALTQAIHAYFPDDGRPPREPEVITFADPNAGYQGILNAGKSKPSSGKGGGTGGNPGGSGKPAPHYKHIAKIEKLLDDLDAQSSGQPTRITTTEIVLGVINNERPITDLRKHLTQD